MRKRLLLIAALLSAAACDRRHPSNALTDLSTEGSVPSASADWVLYDDELRTGGGYFLIPGSGNQDLLDGAGSAAVGRKSLRYAWTGGDVNGQHLFAGFGLLVADDASRDASTPPRNLSDRGFTKITFWAKGDLSEDVLLRAEGPSDGTQSTIAPRLEISRDALAAGWTQYALSVPSPSAFASVKQYVIFTLIYSQPTGTTAAGEGGTVYIDQVAYER